MPDELKHQLRQLVADPPPPRGVPSEVVYERIRTVRRRRAAGAAAAAVGGGCRGGSGCGHSRRAECGPTRHPHPERPQNGRDTTTDDLAKHQSDVLQPEDVDIGIGSDPAAC